MPARTKNLWFKHQAPGKKAHVWLACFVPMQQFQRRGQRQVGSRVFDFCAQPVSTRMVWHCLLFRYCIDEVRARTVCIQGLAWLAQWTPEPCMPSMMNRCKVMRNVQIRDYEMVYACVCVRWIRRMLPFMDECIFLCMSMNKAYVNTVVPAKLCMCMNKAYVKTVIPARRCMYECMCACAWRRHIATKRRMYENIYVCMNKAYVDTKLCMYAHICVCVN